jgi:hypothetical protein
VAATAAGAAGPALSGRAGGPGCGHDRVEFGAQQLLVGVDDGQELLVDRFRRGRRGVRLVRVVTHGPVPVRP